MKPIAFALAPVLWAASLAQAADGNFAGKVRCLDGEGNEKFYDAKAMLSGATLDITLGPGSWRRTLDAQGKFQVSLVVPNRRGSDLAHMEGRVSGDAILLKHIGGRATCSASLAHTGG